MANIPGTNVPAVAWGTTGFIAPQPADVLTGVEADIDAAFGRTLSYLLNTPQGQIASTEAALIVAFNALFVYYTQQVDPAYASGRMQDGIARIYFIERIPALATSVIVTCTGAVGVSIPAGSLISDDAGYIYASIADALIPSGGSVAVTFDNQLPGPIPTPESVTIYQAIPGWDSVAVASGTVGRDTESRQAFEDRRAATVAGNSFGAIGSIIGAVSEVADVEDYWGYDNSSNAPVTVQGVTIPANSIWITVTGGTDDAVAQAILSKKAPGCGYGGNTTITAYDSNPLYASPIPYDVTFERPDALEILFAVNIVNGPTVPANAVDLVRTAIVSAFFGGDGQPRARIASTILATRFIAPVAALGTWAQIRSLLIGSNNASSAQFTGVIAGTALTASAITGTIAVGQTVSGTGVANGTTILSGAGSSWVVSISQTVSSTAMLSAVPNQNSVIVQGDQQPDAVEPNIAVTIT